MEIDIYNETNEKLDKELETVHNVLIHGLKKLKIDEAIFNVIIVYSKLYLKIYTFIFIYYMK